MVPHSFMEEFSELSLLDKRVSQRFVSTLDTFKDGGFESINRSSSTWAQAKSMYRLFSNPKLEADKILEIHREQILWRTLSLDEGTIIAIQDTTKLNFSRHPSMEGLGSIAMGGFGIKSRGCFLHPTLLMTESERFLGIADVVQWSRAKASGESEQKKWFSCIPILGELAHTSGKRIIHVADRESDQVALYQRLTEVKVNYVIRAKKKMRSSQNINGFHLPNADLLKYVEKTFDKLGTMLLELSGREPRDPHGKNAKRGSYNRTATLEILFGKLEQGELTHNVVVAKERLAESQGGICWILKTNLEVDGYDGALKIIDFYKKRWHIETYFKVLKTTCGIEKSCLREYERLKKYVLAQVLIGWRIYALKCESINNPLNSCEEVLTQDEMILLEAKYSKSNTQKERTEDGLFTIREAVKLIAQMGGHLGRKGDGPPGVVTLGRGLDRLEAMAEGVRQYREYGCPIE